MHSSILAWRIPWTEETGRSYSPWDHKESDTTEVAEHTQGTKLKTWDVRQWGCSFEGKVC